MAGVAKNWGGPNGNVGHLALGVCSGLYPFPSVIWPWNSGFNYLTPLYFSKHFGKQALEGSEWSHPQYPRSTLSLWRCQSLRSQMMKLRSSLLAVGGTSAVEKLCFCFRIRMKKRFHSQIKIKDGFRCRRTSVICVHELPFKTSIQWIIKWSAAMQGIYEPVIDKLQSFNVITCAYWGAFSMRFRINVGRPAGATAFTGASFLWIILLFWFPLEKQQSMYFDGGKFLEINIVLVKNLSMFWQIDLKVNEWISFT